MTMLILAVMMIYFDLEWIVYAKLITCICASFILVIVNLIIIHSDDDYLPHLSSSRQNYWSSSYYNDFPHQSLFQAKWLAKMFTSLLIVIIPVIIMTFLINHCFRQNDSLPFVLHCTCGGIGDPFSIILNKVIIIVITIFTSSSSSSSLFSPQGPKPELGVPYYGTRFGHNLAHQIKQKMVDLNITKVNKKIVMMMMMMMMMMMITKWFTRSKKRCSISISQKWWWLWWW